MSQTKYNYNYYPSNSRIISGRLNNKYNYNYNYNYKHNYMFPGINSYGVYYQNYKSRPISNSIERNNILYSRKYNQISVIDLNANLNLPNLARKRRDMENSRYILSGKNILKNNKSNINPTIANLNKNDIKLNFNYNLYSVNQENKKRNIIKPNFEYSNNENYYQKIFDRKNEKSTVGEQIIKIIDKTNKEYNIRIKSGYSATKFILKGKENLFPKPKNNYETNKINLDPYNKGNNVGYKKDNKINKSKIIEGAKGKNIENYILISEGKKDNQIKNRINSEAKKNITKDKKENFIKSKNEKNLENVKVNQVINKKDNENKKNIVKEVKKENGKKIIINANKENEINIKEEEIINNAIKNNSEESKKENLIITKKENKIINDTNKENKNKIKNKESLEDNKIKKFF